MKEIGRNDPCWCGSGLKYKRCHLLRSEKKRLPFKAIISEAQKAVAYTTCLHPDASKENCGNVISAHTLQRTRVIKSIVDNTNHLLSFYPPNIDETTGTFLPQKRGWKQAATFDAFCDVHDDSTFRRLEKEPFTASPHQIFLIGYRALCWEYYQKVRIQKAIPVFQKNVDRGTNPRVQRSVQAMFDALQRGFKQGENDLKQLKKRLDRSLVNLDFTDYKMVEILLQGSTSLVSTGAITPNHTLVGDKLQVLHNEHENTEWLAFGFDISERGTSIVFHWFDSEVSPTEYMNEVFKLTESQLLAFLPQFFFAHCENTYFECSWWEKIGNTERNLLTGLMSNPNPYYHLPEYDLDKLTTDWTLIEINEISTT